LILSILNTLSDMKTRHPGLMEIRTSLNSGKMEDSIKLKKSYTTNMESRLKINRYNSATKIKKRLRMTKILQTCHLRMHLTSRVVLKDVGIQTMSMTQNIKGLP
jgi:hypothetical protein